jgi:AraC-like DNA-binding protein
MDNMTEIEQSLFLSMFRIGKCYFYNKHDFNSSIGNPHISIGYLINGSVEFESSTEHFEFGSGGMVYIPKGESYSSHWHGSPEIEFYSLQFLFNPTTQSENSSIFRRYKLQKINSPDNSIKNQFNALYSIYSRGSNYLLQAIGEFYLLYSGIAEMLIYEELPIVKNPVQKAMHYIEGHATEDFHIADLAKLCNMSEPRFYDTFKRFTGYTPIAYKNRVRIQQALTLLSDKENTVEWISNYLNFNSPAYFRKVFKQVTGTTPHESRYSL